MRRRLFTVLLAGAVLLSGCAKPADQAELTAARQDIADLQKRIDTLETRLQSVEAALPDDDRLPDPPANPQSAPTS